MANGSPGAIRLSHTWYLLLVVVVACVYVHVCVCMEQANNYENSEQNDLVGLTLDISGFVATCFHHCFNETLCQQTA